MCKKTNVYIVEKQLQKKKKTQKKTSPICIFI